MAEAVADATALTWDQVTMAIQAVAIERGHYGGYPTPVEGRSLQLARGFPVPGLGARFGGPDVERVCTNDDVDDSVSVRNEWSSRRLRARVWIYTEKGRIRHLVDPTADHTYRLRMLFDTAHASLGWRTDAELVAQDKLQKLVGDDRFMRYLCTGIVAETSPRSGVTYLFRRLRPTIAVRARDDDTHFLAALCMHPIGYYTDTFAGSMVPTDDLIAHLLLMRADEKLFWRRCNQHPAWKPQAGI